MLRLVRPQRLLQASASTAAQLPRITARSFTWTRSASSSLDDWTRTMQAQRTTMHDTADLNKARQLLLVLPNLSSPSTNCTSSRTLIDKHSGEQALSLRTGSPMPLGSELVLFNPLLSEHTLGTDGTETTFGPPGGLDQRMWASGSFQFEQGKQLQVGDEVECDVVVESVVPKQGAKTGLIVLVTRKLVYRNAEGVVLTERRCHVYRKQRPADQRKYVPPVGGKAPSAAEVQEKSSDFGFDYYATRAALFRYSAATFNAHRIHLDPEYCRNEEGHPDCLVHGPLTATLLLNLVAAAAKEASGQVQTFEYRATSPLTVEQTVRLRGAWQGAEKKGASLWALNQAGTVCMTAKATLF
ncbi:related to HTD2-mitochondrial 3-hydroxyacyl-thioester dehydratase [Sporisorium reilianum f. sp. reilianum]|uniref:Related to HTD2-mitochondrial 3-hydroxyacyl-thioester dehydratase n=1 Tax=Sporisorium reilianum f. sp. reilianum TaxID=72559 RepID=A0A2N8UAR0_9BASI|nr:related to HTD2-mitochondrial 3-hydroxyacyl-thioester dehydratase [Sporisorium reilianum f. sp. reilianum]